MKNSELFLEYKKLLFSIAYDMLGSIADAEDIVQETYLKWISVNSGKVQYPKAYLVKTVTNISINYLKSARKKREEYIGTWLPEPFDQYGSDESEKSVEIYSSLSVGMMVILERLTPIERAVFLFKEVFSYDYAEISGITEKTEENCRQIFRRAKLHLGDDRKRFSIDIQAHEKLLNEFTKACRYGDIESLVELLKDDITLYADAGGRPLILKGEKIIALPRPLSGSRKVAKFLIRIINKVEELSENPSSKIILMNGMPVRITYSDGKPINLTILEIADGRISNIYSYGNPPKIKNILKFVNI